jgi:hypothetical protein
VLTKKSAKRKAHGAERNSHVIIDGRWKREDGSTTSIAIYKKTRISLSWSEALQKFPHTHEIVFHRLAFLYSCRPTKTPTMFEFQLLLVLRRLIY